jgi:hypothetical protein
MNTFPKYLAEIKGFLGLYLSIIEVKIILERIHKLYNRTQNKK